MSFQKPIQSINIINIKIAKVSIENTVTEIEKQEIRGLGQRVSLIMIK